MPDGLDEQEARARAGMIQACDEMISSIKAGNVTYLAMWAMSPDTKVLNFALGIPSARIEFVVGSIYLFLSRMASNILKTRDGR